MNIKHYSEQVLMYSEDIKLLKIENSAFDKRVLKIEQKDTEINAGIDKRLQEILDDMPKTTKILQFSRIECGGYKEEPDNLTFTGDANDNLMEFLR